MKIQADQEATQIITKMTDALLKAYWNEVFWMVTKVLWSVSSIPVQKEPVKKEPEAKQETKTKK